MAEETKQEVREEKAETKPAKTPAKIEVSKKESPSLDASKPSDSSKKEPAKPDAKPDQKPDTKKESPKKAPVKPEIKKEEAIAKAQNLRASKRHFMYICSFIKNKPIDTAIKDLEQVKILKKVVPFKGEIPHRKGKGMMSGRYPVKAADLMIKVLKGLKGSVLVNNMELEKTRIKIASASWASRPMRSGNRQGKRTNVILVAKELVPGGNK